MSLHPVPLQRRSRMWFPVWESVCKTLGCGEREPSCWDPCCKKWIWDLKKMSTQSKGFSKAESFTSGQWCRDAVGLPSTVPPQGNSAEVPWLPIHCGSPGEWCRGAVASHPLWLPWAFIANKEGFCASLSGQSLAACPFVIYSYRTAQFLDRNET